MQISDNVFLNVVDSVNKPTINYKVGETHINIIWDESDLCWKFFVVREIEKEVKFNKEIHRISTPVYILQKGECNNNFTDSNKFFELIKHTEEGFGIVEPQIVNDGISS